MRLFIFSASSIALFHYVLPGDILQEICHFEATARERDNCRESTAK